MKFRLVLTFTEINLTSQKYYERHSMAEGGLHKTRVNQLQTTKLKAIRAKKANTQNSNSRNKKICPDFAFFGGILHLKRMIRILKISSIRIMTRAFFVRRLQLSLQPNLGYMSQGYPSSLQLGKNHPNSLAAQALHSRFSSLQEFKYLIRILFIPLPPSPSMTLRSGKNGCRRTCPTVLFPSHLQQFFREMDTPISFLTQTQFIPSSRVSSPGTILLHSLILRHLY